MLDYAGCHVWSEQIRDFVKEARTLLTAAAWPLRRLADQACTQVVGGGRVTLVGNSLGGYTSLLTAAKYPDIVNGVVLVNAGKRPSSWLS